MLHMRGFNGAMNTRLGRGYVFASINWFFQLEGGIALVAKNHNDQLLGYVIGAPLGYGKQMNRNLFWVAGRAFFMRPWLFLSQQIRATLKLRLWAVFDQSQKQEIHVDLPAPIMSLVGLVVDPHVQGQNIGNLLVKAFEDRAGELHFRSLRLSVYPENSPARRVYEKCGWVTWERSVSSGKPCSTIGFFSFLTMVVGFHRSFLFVFL